MKLSGRIIIEALLVFFLIFNFNSAAQEIASVELGDAVTVQVYVCGVFKSDRTLWVYPPGDPESIFELEVSEEARNYDQLEVGDIITVTYYESAAISLVAPGQLPSENKGVVLARTEKGEKPGGIAIEVYDISAVISSFDKENGLVTLTGPRGNSLVTIVSDEVAASGLIVPGEIVHVRYTRNMAISVEPFKK
jgi:hypothetical protein